MLLTHKWINELSAGSKNNPKIHANKGKIQAKGTPNPEYS